MDHGGNELLTALNTAKCLCVAVNRENASLALRLHVERFPGDRHTGESRTITRIYQRVLDNVPIVPLQ